MGNYNQSIQEKPISPDITSTRQYGRTKYGVGINLEQELSEGIGFFARASCNDGRNETWVFTEIDRSVSAGLCLKGTRWKRVNDVMGIGTVMSGLSAQHQNYLSAGGYGFIIGDGKLNYGMESVTEIYYKANVFSESFYITPNYQFAYHPVYNKNRGPAHLIGLRAPIEF